MESSLKELAGYRMERAKEMLNSAYFRENSDYDDFFLASRKDAQQQLADATLFLAAVEKYVCSITNCS